MSTTAIPDRFTTLPDEHGLQATVTALEEHGFSVEVVGDLDAARQAVLARIPEGSPVMTNASVTPSRSTRNCPAASTSSSSASRSASSRRASRICRQHPGGRP